MSHDNTLRERTRPGESSRASKPNRSRRGKEQPSGSRGNVPSVPARRPVHLQPPPTQLTTESLDSPAAQAPAPLTDTQTESTRQVGRWVGGIAPLSTLTPLEIAAIISRLSPMGTWTKGHDTDRLHPGAGGMAAASCRAVYCALRRGVKPGSGRIAARGYRVAVAGSGGC